MKSREKHPFTIWIDEIGASRLARLLGIHVTTVYKWRGGQWPHVSQMREIRKISKGKMSYDLMIDGECHQ